MKRYFAFIMLAFMLAGQAAGATNWKGVDAALGRAGTVQAGDVHRYGFPRSDLNVSVDRVRIKPALALGSWLAFHDVGDHSEVMGDLVLTQSEVNPVLSRLLEGGLTITALHNHLLRSTPATMYMHVHGMGDALTLARALRQALAASHTPTGSPAPAPAEAGPPSAGIRRPSAASHSPAPAQSRPGRGFLRPSLTGTLPGPSCP